MNTISASKSIYHKAWTGGSRPAPLSTISRCERILISILFAEQVRDYVNAWGSIDLETARVLWGRARYDAHATLRGFF